MGSGTEVNPAVLRRLRVLGPVSAIVYLFLLRESGVEAGEWFECSTKKVREGLELSDKPVRRALRYLEDLDIIEVDAAQNQRTATRMRMVSFLPVDKSSIPPVDNYSAAVNSTEAPPSSFHFDLTEEQVKPQVNTSAAVNSTEADDSEALIIDTGLFALGGSAEGGVNYEQELIDVQFVEFWALYPPSGSSKPKSYIAFNKAIRKIEFSVMMSAVHSYIEYLKQPKSYTCKMAATWLNQECWGNRYPAAKKSDTFAAARGADYYSDC